MRKPALFFSLVLLGIAIDLATKKVAFDVLPAGSLEYSVVPGVLAFVHAENHGVAFSLLNQRYWPIVVITLAAIGFLTWLYFRSRQTAQPLALVAMNLMLMGAIGNLIDRIWLHYVRDFILFVPTLPLVGQWPVFNVADICITTGVLTFAVVELFLTPAAKDQSSTAAEPMADNSI